MPTTRPRYSKEEFARRGDTLYEGHIRPLRLSRASVSEIGSSYYRGKIWCMATTTMSSKGQVVIPRTLREKLGLREGSRLDISERQNALVLTPARASAPSGWRVWRGRLRGGSALRDHVAEHRRDAKR